MKEWEATETLKCQDTRASSFIHTYLLNTYCVPGTVLHCILTASYEVGIISSIFIDEESKSQRDKNPVQG